MCLSLEFGHTPLAESTLHLLSRADQQLVSWLSLRCIDGVRRQFQHTCGLRLQGRNTESREMLDDVDYLLVIIHIDQIQREQHAHGMNSAGRHDPESLINPQLEFSNQPFQARERRIGRGDTQTEETFAGLVVYAVCPSIHRGPDSSQVHGDKTFSKERHVAGKSNWPM